MNTTRGAVALFGLIVLVEYGYALCLLQSILEGVTGATDPAGAEGTTVARVVDSFTRALEVIFLTVALVFNLLAALLLFFFLRRKSRLDSLAALAGMLAALSLSLPLNTAAVFLAERFPLLPGWAGILEGTALFLFPYLLVAVLLHSRAKGTRPRTAVSP